ncbi:hypothetical protein FOZ63_016711, partial [Perkinsus olseni]
HKSARFHSRNLGSSLAKIVGNSQHNVRPMADSSPPPLPKGSSALNVIQDVAESAPASPSSASSLGSPRAQHYDVDIEDVSRSAFGTPSVEPSDLPPLPTRASPSESPAEVRRKRRRGKKPLRDQVRRHQLLRAEPEAFQPSEPGTTGDDRTSRCPEKCEQLLLMFDTA